MLMPSSITPKLFKLRDRHGHWAYMLLFNLSTLAAENFIFQTILWMKRNSMHYFVAITALSLFILPLFLRGREKEGKEE